MSYPQPVDSREAPHARSIMSLRDLTGEPSLHQILGAVSAVTRTPMRELTGYGRNRYMVDARFIYFLLARQLTGKSFPQIGREVHRDHTTAMHGAHQAKIRKAEFAEKIAAVHSLLKLASPSEFVVTANGALHQ
jgi:chromosomal replication initiation ATPase DnaA